VQVKRSQDDLDDGGGEEEDNDLEDGVYDSNGFVSGDTSGVTTRASTPRGHHGPGQPHAHSHSSSDNLPSVAEKGGAEDSTQEDADQDEHHQNGRHSHDLIINSVAAASLTPMTPREAEARIKRTAAAAVATNHAAAPPGTTTRTATREAVHTATTTTHAAPTSQQSTSFPAPASSGESGKRVVG
jgi:hypothetical protein